MSVGVLMRMIVFVGMLVFVGAVHFLIPFS
jgi:hypothetical protein